MYGLSYLDEFEDPSLVVDEAVGLYVGLDGVLQLRVAALIERDAWEEIVDEGEEEWFILVHQFGQVHVAKHAHHDGLLRVVGTATLDCTKRT